MENIILLAVVSAVVGAMASTVQGYWKAESGYSIKKLASAIISSGFTAFGVVNLVEIPNQVETVGVVGLVIANLLLGFGIDQAHAKLDK